ncbi:MAG TPA: nucleotidyltransferase family protein [Pyrinomonadaceae bacterium]|nr:nucleotidyltransferase family protein [Pyrinomonadaceae bacterium]
MKTVAAILLAAGRSRRMGAFKPLLPFGDTTIVEACIDNLRAGGVEELIVVVGHRAEELRTRLAHVPSLSFALNDEVESEMGASIARGVERVSADVKTVLVALADYPAVPPFVIRKLIDEHERTGALLVVPEWQGRGGHPVLVDMRFREALLNLDSRGGLRALFDAHRGDALLRRVPVDSPYVTRDADTWEDYCALHEEVFGRRPPDAPRQ